MTDKGGKRMANKTLQKLIDLILIDATYRCGIWGICYTKPLFLTCKSASMQRILVVVFFLNAFLLSGQYHFSGEVAKDHYGKSVYLSLVEDYRKSSRVYLEQIIRKTTVDSLGSFAFKGNNLLNENRIYRIHVDSCAEDGEHFLGQCNNSQSVLFLANNKDSIQFPITYENQALCSIGSTNPASSAILDIQALKEEMIVDFTDYRSEASRKLNSEKWFGMLQDAGGAFNEPLVDLYLFDFLSDKRSETYTYYLKDITTNNYYFEVLDRLKETYPNAIFTRQYEAEIDADRQLANFNKPKLWDWKWAFWILLVLSIGLNLYLLMNRRAKAQKRAASLLEKLTPQEQKIVHQILQDKSNKEIASELFVSHSTIKTHINNLYKKLEVSSRQEIVAIFKK